ncbi:influenza virus NS1A-binding protein homolog [Cyclospora cayetanensis]|uniref:Influenza virus NS1A-binding protein homolog n=1 Tax=Cyclospora cayetanensis TaxID=88456 RepID=A0A6P6RZ99_9EIME|nr:influenza virus NS1A-binding protein homolog [Cyclospora cayetanensis]
MVGDLRRTFISWLRHTEAELKRERNDLVRRKREFEEEKKKVWALFQQDKQNEYNKIKEERRAAQAEMQQQLKQLQIEREDTRSKLQVEKQKFQQEQEAVRRKHVLERERFRQEVLAFESERQRIVDSSIAAETVVDLNVGGVVFETSRQTLIQQRGSFLENLLSGRHHVARDRQGRIFLDRDAEMFRVILNFLRQPNAPPQPRDSAESDALTVEAAFLGIRFFPDSLIFALGGHSGNEHLSSVEMLDLERQQWRPSVPMKTERAYAAAGAINNKIYIYGGQNLDYKALCDVEVYDALLGAWFGVPPLSVPRRNACGTALNGLLYAIGGFDGESILASVECLDTRMKNWRQTAPLNCPRCSAMCCTHGDSLLVLGGTKGERLRSAEVYEPRMDQWQPLSCSMIEVRSAGCAVSANNHIYAIGGMDSGHQIHSTLEVLDPEGKQWTFLSPLPGPRMDCVTGGQDGEVLKSTCFYSPEANEWRAGPSMLNSRYGHSLVITTL